MRPLSCSWTGHVAATAVLLLAAREERADAWTGLRSAVARVGDVNADGVADLVVASRERERPEQAWIVSGKDGVVRRPLNAHGDRPGFACAVGRAGDVHGDGVPDVWVAARGWPVRYREMWLGELRSASRR